MGSCSSWGVLPGLASLADHWLSRRCWDADSWLIRGCDAEVRTLFTDQTLAATATRQFPRDLVPARQSHAIGATNFIGSRSDVVKKPDPDSEEHARLLSTGRTPLS
eukprot:gene14832-biopygen8131